MAREAGTMKQYQGPFTSEDVLQIYGHCVIGISISEDDYYKCGSTAGDRSFEFEINGNPQTFFMGRTYIYQTQQQYTINTITFPSGAPESTLVDVIYCSERS